MQRVVVLNVVGLTPGQLGAAPQVSAFARQSGGVIPLSPVFPAVTCSVQASMLTGLEPGTRRGAESPADPNEVEGCHGVVGNGWYDREQAEIRFWQRADSLVRGEKVWEAARRLDLTGSFTCANLFWWHNTHADCEVVLQARPIYKADGRKIPDIYCNLPDLRESLQRPVSGGGLGRFPLFSFWGPGAGLASSAWIAAAAQRVEKHHRPTLQLVYLPHLDYDLQRHGPGTADAARALAEVDRLVGELVEWFAQHGVRPLIVSEYGIEPTCPGGGAVMINRWLRDRGWLAVRTEGGREMLDPGGSAAFAVTDHQVAHVYLNYHGRSAEVDDVRWSRRAVADLTEGLLGLDGVANVGVGGSARAGDLVLEAEAGRWFAYDYWPADRPERAPDFARTVDIHRKPGYDPRELHLDPALRWPRAAVGWRLLRKRLGFRQLLDVVSLDPQVVKGTHGRRGGSVDDGPLMIGFGSAANSRLVSGATSGELGEALPCTAVKGVVLEMLGLGEAEGQ